MDNKSPLAMLVRACETIGCNNDSPQNSGNNNSTKKLTTKNGSQKFNSSTLNGTGNRHLPLSNGILLLYKLNFTF